MRVVQTIRIEQIEHGKSPLNFKVFSFARAMFWGDVFPPINVEQVSKGKFKLRNGRHRLAAHKLLGRKGIRAHIAIKEEPYPYKPFVSKEA